MTLDPGPVLTVFAPVVVGDVAPGSDLVELVLTAVAGHPAGPLVDGDIVVLTSKVVSKAEGRHRAAVDREAAIDDESLGTVARRGPTRIVRTRHGLTLAAAGVDNSNVAPDTVLLLPVDPDASARRLRDGLRERAGVHVGVVVSDTAGRAWRLGQTDQAIGAAGVRVLERYAGRQDSYGNELRVTAVAVADELASAADLVKGKLAGRPVAVVRGLSEQVVEEPTEPTAESVAGARGLVRPDAEDMFGYGSREAVVAAVLAAVGHPEGYEEALAQPGDEALVSYVLSRSDLTGGAADLLERVLRAGLRTRA